MVQVTVMVTVMAMVTVTAYSIAMMMKRGQNIQKNSKIRKTLSI
jgi:hypothetical protein